MKEFIEKLIGRLEENTMIMANSKEFWNNPQNGKYVSEVIPKEKAISIVNQLAEKYKNESVKGDLISRSLLMEALNKSDRDARTDADIQGYCDGWNDVVEIINEQPKTNVNGWIPCSERMPEDCNNVLCTVHQNGSEETVLLLWYNTKTRKWLDYNFEDVERYLQVIAWQPLPAPYKQDK